MNKNQGENYIVVRNPDGSISGFEYIDLRKKMTLEAAISYAKELSTEYKSSYLVFKIIGETIVGNPPIDFLEDSP